MDTRNAAKTVSAVILLLLPWATAARAEEAEIFMTGARFAKKGSYGPEWEPTKTKIAYAWHDKPFAVHIPFLAEVHNWGRDWDGVGDAYYTGKDYTIECYLRGMEFRGYRDSWRSPSLFAIDTGTYMLDGSKSDRTTKGRPISSNPLKQYQNPGGNYRNRITRFKSRLSIRAPGRAAFWMVIDPRMASDLREGFQKKHGKETTGTLFVTVYRHDYTYDEGHSKIISRKKKEVLKQTFKIKIRQNGWVIRKGTIKVTGNWQMDLHPRDRQRRWHVADRGSKFKNGTWTTSSRLTGTGRESGRAERQSDITTIVKLPILLLDTIEYRADISQSLTARGEYGPDYQTKKLNKFSKLMPHTFPFDAERQKKVYAGSPGLSDDWKIKRVRDGVWEGTNIGWIQYIKLRNVLPEKWDYSKTIGEHRLFSIIMSTQDTWANKYKTAPARRLDLYALRLSEHEDNRLGGVRGEAPRQAIQFPDDGYWKWKDSFLDTADKTVNGVSDLCTVLRVLQKEILQEDARLMAALQRAKEALRMDDDLVNMDTALPGKKMIEGLKRPVSASRGRIDSLKAQQKQTIEGSLGKFDKLVASIKAQAERSRKKKRRREGLQKTLEYLQDQRAMAELQLHDAAGWPEAERLLRVIHERERQTGAVGDLAKVMHASWNWRRSQQQDRELRWQRMQQKYLRNPKPPSRVLVNSAAHLRRMALVYVRDVLRGTPDHDAARTMEAEIETWWLNRIAAKLDQECKVSLAQFQKYLAKRDFNADSPETTWDTLCEYGRYMWGAGPGNVCVGVLNMPGIMEEYTSSVQDEAARDQVSILLMKRLVKVGVPLRDQPKIRKEKLGLILGMNTESCENLPPHRAWQLMQDLLTTYRTVPEIKGIAHASEESQLQELDRVFAKRYFELLDAEQGRLEWFGDIASPRNLVMFWLGSPSGGQQYIARAFRGLGQLPGGTRVANSGLVQALSGKLQAEREFYAALTGWKKFTYNADSVLAAIMVYGSAAHLADELDMPKVRCLVDLLAIVGAHEIAGRLMAGSGVSAQKAWQSINVYKKHVQSQRGQLTQLTKTVREIETVSASITPGPAGRVKLTPAQSKALGKLDDTLSQMGKKPQQAAAGGPGVSVSDWGRQIGKKKPVQSHLDRKEATIDGAKALVATLNNGQKAEAKRVADFVKKSAKKMEDTLEAQSKKIKEAEESVKAMTKPVKPKQGAIETPVVPAATVDAPVQGGQQLNPSKIVTEVTPSGQVAAAPPPAASSRVNTLENKPLAGLDPRKKLEDVPPDTPVFTDRKAYAADPTGFRILEADNALKNNDINQAIRSYRVARRAARKKGLNDLAKFLDDRIASVCVSKTVRNAAKLRRSKAASGVAKALKGPEVNTAKARVANGTLKVDRLKTGSKFPCFKISENGKPKYFFKEINDSVLDPKVPAFTKEREVTSEVFGAAIFNALGMKTPSAHPCKLTIPILNEAGEKIGEKTRFGIMYRHLDGQSLIKMKEGAAIATKKDYARARVIRALLCETDGHPGNQVIGRDGRYYPVDFGMSQLDDSYRLPQQGFGTDYGDTMSLLRAAVELPRFWLAAGKGFGLINRMDQLVDYRDMVPVIREVKKLCGDERKLRELLEQFGLPGDTVDNAVKVLRERGANMPGKDYSPLEKVLKDKFDRPIEKMNINKWHGTPQSRLRRRIRFPSQEAESQLKAA